MLRKMMHAAAGALLVPVSLAAAGGVRTAELRKEAGFVGVKFGKGVFTRYNFLDEAGKPLVRPFLYPVNASDGTPVTSDQAATGGDHKHHRSVWIGHGDVNGGDHWEKAATGPGVPVQRTATGPDVSGACIIHVLEWEDASGKPVLREKRVLCFRELPGGDRAVDIRSAYSAISGSVTLGDTKEAGLCAVRVAGEISAKPVITNSRGQRTEKECWGRPAEWCDISGKIGRKRYGVTILDHPGNPRHPSRWHVRKYGLLAANVFGLKAFERGKAKESGEMVLAPGAETVFLYRVVVHRGDVDPAKTAELLASFAGGGDPGFVQLLPGNDLTGWRVPDPNPWWTIRNGVLTGKSDPEQRGHVLETEKRYGDLILDTEVRFRGEIDSGIFLRKNDQLQVQIGVSRSLKRDMTCSVYYRGYPGKAEGVAKLLKKGKWNRIRVMARGPRFDVWLNGVQVLEYFDERFRDPGPIGLQIHGGVKMKVEFRNMVVKEL